MSFIFRTCIELFLFFCSKNFHFFVIIHPVCSMMSLFSCTKKDWIYRNTLKEIQWTRCSSGDKHITMNPHLWPHHPFMGSPLRAYTLPTSQQERWGASVISILLPSFPSFLDSFIISSFFLSFQIPLVLLYKWNMCTAGNSEIVKEVQGGGSRANRPLTSLSIMGNFSHFVILI